MRDYDHEIANALGTARDFERMSDASFAAGDPIHGAAYYRFAVLSYERAESLARRQAEEGRHRFAGLRE